MPRGHARVLPASRRRLAAVPPLPPCRCRRRRHVRYHHRCHMCDELVYRAAQRGVHPRPIVLDVRAINSTCGKSLFDRYDGYRLGDMLYSRFFRHAPGGANFHCQRFPGAPRALKSLLDTTR